MNTNIEDILSGSLDSLVDKPEFKPFPAGTHYCIIKSFERIKDKPMLALTLSAVNTIELVNDIDDSPLQPESETSITYLLTNEYGQGAFKEVMKAAAEKYGHKSNIMLIQDCINANVVVVTGVRKSKDGSQSYTDLKHIEFV